MGHPELAREIGKPTNAALESRIKVRCELKPILDRDAFKQLIDHSFAEARCTHQLLSDSALELLRMASKGNPRHAHQLIVTSLRLATDKKITHLPHDIIKEAIALSKQI